MTLNKFHSSKYINFSAAIEYPHKVLIINNSPISKYIFNGKIDTKLNNTSVNVNDVVDIYIDKKIKINTKKIGINIDELLNALASNSSDNSSSSIELLFNAQNSFLYVTDDRHIISDNISLEYINSKLVAKLMHEDGVAGFSFVDKQMQLYGENFNDEFMEKLFYLSKFEGGNLSFSMNGTVQDYHGIFNIEETTVKSYKVLNNVLAFVNTIPSLVTFSLPGYNKKGLKIDNAYITFESKNHDLNISNIYLDSKELGIRGKGTANVKKNRVDVKLNLKTDLASSVSKVPVVGHILFDGDSISTSLSIKGKLDDPKIKSLIAKDIIVAPLNIIKRTLLYPYHLLSDINISSIEEELTE